MGNGVNLLDELLHWIAGFFWKAFCKMINFLWRIIGIILVFLWRITFGSLFAPVGIVRKIFAWIAVIFIVIMLAVIIFGKVKG